MIISKESIFAKTLKELIVGSKTPNFSTVVSKVAFVKNKGVFFAFESNIDSIFLKIDSITENFKVDGNIFVSALNSALEDGDVELKIDLESKKVNFSNFSFDIENSSYYIPGNIIEPIITFNNEQFKSIEKDFFLTLGNFFQNTKNTDTIFFGIKEGSLYQVAPGCGIYKIKDVDGIVDEVNISQKFGHSNCIYLFPHKIFDLFKNEETVKISFSENNMLLESNNIFINFTCPTYGTSIFLRRLNDKNIDDGLNISIFNPIKQTLNNLTKNLFEDNEDFNILVKNSEGKLELTIDNMTIETESECFEEFTFNVNVSVLSFILNNLPETTRFKKLDTFIIFQNDNESLFINNCELV